MLFDIYLVCVIVLILAVTVVLGIIGIVLRLAAYRPWPRAHLEQHPSYFANLKRIPFPEDE